MATLMIGLGMTIAIFAMADPFLLAPLPYTRPEQLVVIQTEVGREQGAPDERPQIPLITDWQERSEFFQDLAAYGPLEQVRIQSDDGSAFMLWMIPVTANLLDLLDGRSAPESRGTGVPPLPAVEREIIVSPEISTRIANLPARLSTADGHPLRATASWPQTFVFPAQFAFRRPDAVFVARFGPTIQISPGRHDPLVIIARLQPGVEPDVVAAALAADRGLRVSVQRIDAYMKGRLRPLPFGTLAASLLITFVCIANVVNLLLARLRYRRRDLATRRALGASIGDLRIQLVAEIATLALIGAAAGLLLGHFMLAALNQVVPSEFTALGHPAVTGRVIFFAAALGAIALAVLVAVGWSALDVHETAQEAPWQSLGASRTGTLRHVLVGAQSAVAIILLTGSTLLLRSYVSLISQDIGFDRDLSLVSALFPRDRPAVLLRQDLEDALQSISRIPGVDRSAVIAGPLLDDFAVVGGTRLRIAGRLLLQSARQVSAGYFETSGIAIRPGRKLLPDDSGWRSIVINVALARRLWPDRALEEVIGESVLLDDGTTGGQIVGVVENTHDRSLDVPPASMMYRPLENPSANLPIHLVVQARADERRVLADVRRALSRSTPGVVVLYAGALADRMAATVGDRSFATLVMSLFSAAALSVTTCGSTSCAFRYRATCCCRRSSRVAADIVEGQQTTDSGVHVFVCSDHGEWHLGYGGLYPPDDPPSTGS